MRYHQTNNVRRNPGNSRPHKSIAHQDLHILKIVKVDPRKSVGNVANYGNEQVVISTGVHTTRNKSREADLLARRPAKKQLTRNKKNRLDFGRRYLHLSKEQCAKIL